MHKRRIPWLLVMLFVSPTPAMAQSETPTRAEAAQQAREAKAAAPVPPTTGRVERLMTTIETGPMFQQFFTANDGFGVRVGSIDGGTGLAGGPTWRKSNMFSGRLQLHASAAVSTRRDHVGEAGLAIPELGTHRLGMTIDLSNSHLAENRFFGVGPETNRADQTAFALDQRSVIGTITLNSTGWLQFAGSAGTVRAVASDARSARMPDVSSRFAIDDTAGLDTQTSFTALSLSATVDYRDVPLNPRSGGRYSVAVNRYRDQTSDRYSFTRIDTELEQHLSGWKKQRLLTLRAIASASVADRGQDVPFYMQRTLGGSTLLRGFVTDRFRDRNLLALQAEYGWDVMPFLNAVLFYEAGAVAPRWQDLTSTELRRDYGIGFRFGSARRVALRTDVAFGSGEGTRFTMRFSHAF